MIEHIVFGIVIFILLIISLIGYNRAKRVSVYRYRNIAFMSIIPALVVILGIQLIEVIGHNEKNIKFADFILEIPERFAFIAAIFFMILAVLMGVSNLVLMKKEGMGIKNAVGTILFAFCLICTVGIYGVVYFFDVHNFLPFLLYCFIDYFECIMIGIMILGFEAAIQKPKYDKDFIIIPGCSISKTGGLLPLLKGRVNRAIKYAWNQECSNGKPVQYIPSGGQGRDEIMSEGSAMELYLLSHSAESYEIFAEKESKNTYENFLFSKRIIESKKDNAKVAFATTNYHMFRCGLLARKMGMPAEGIASKTKWYFWPNGFAREMIAIFVLTKKYHIVSMVLITILSIVLAIISKL